MFAPTSWHITVNLLVILRLLDCGLIITQSDEDYDVLAVFLYDLLESSSIKEYSFTPCFFKKPQNFCIVCNDLLKVSGFLLTWHLSEL